MKPALATLLAAAFLVIVILSKATAQMPRILSYQGTLVSGSTVVPDGNYNVTFRLYTREHCRQCCYQRKDPRRTRCVKFEGSGLSSGVYFYRLQVRPLDSAVGRDSKSGAWTHVETKKLLLVR